jgi:CheY-like chemotaxis protein
MATYAFDDRLGKPVDPNGACFSYESKELPLSTPYPSQANESQPDLASKDLALYGRQVLLVEDCPDQGRLYLKFLQCAGAEVTLECTGQSAVDTIRKAPDLFDSVIMDFQMPELDGLDATRQLRGIGYQGTIIGVTAFNSEDLRTSWFHAGCNDLLDKPLAHSALIHAIL